MRAGCRAAQRNGLDTLTSTVYGLFMTNAKPAFRPAAAVSRNPARDREGVFARAEEAVMAEQLRLLERLAESAMVLARAAGKRATRPAGTEAITGSADQVATFGQAARAVRQTIGLEVKLRAERRARDSDAGEDAATERQLELLQELARICFAVARAPGNSAAVPIFLRVARAVRHTIVVANTLRHPRAAPDKAATPAPSAAEAAEPAANPEADEGAEEPVAGGLDVASSLAQTLDAFNEYYRFLRMPIAQAVARIFKTLGLPVESGHDGGR